MKQLGNLAIVCAQRQDVLLQVLNGSITVYVGCGPAKATLHADWNDDQQISNIVHELNFGRLKEDNDENRRCG